MSLIVYTVIVHVGTFTTRNTKVKTQPGAFIKVREINITYLRVGWDMWAKWSCGAEMCLSGVAAGQ